MPRKKRHRLSKLSDIRRHKKLKGQSVVNEEAPKDDDFDTFLATRVFDCDQNQSNYNSNIRTSLKTDSDGLCADEFIVILDKPYVYYACDDLDEFVANISSRLISDLKEKSRQLSQEFDNFIFCKQSKDITFIQLYDRDRVNMAPRVKLCVSVSCNFEFDIVIHGKPLPQAHEIWEKIKRQCFSVDHLRKALQEIGQYSVCCGNNDEELQDLMPPGASCDAVGQPKYVGYRETGYLNSTIRSTSCYFLIKGNRCRNCGTYRKTLRKTLSRRSNKDDVRTPDKNWMASKVRNDHLSDTQKIQKIRQLKSFSGQLESELNSLRKLMHTHIKKHGVVLNDTDSADLSSLMESCTGAVEENFPDQNSYQRLFWEQQLKFAKLKNKKSMRWHPTVIKWCIYLKSKSTASYDALRNSGFITLPSERTLFDYSHVIKKGTGFKSDIISMFIDESSRLKDYQQIVGILQDEIKVKSDLVYDKHTGELIGFVDLGDTNNNIMKLEEAMKSKSKALAQYVLVIMVRGIASNFKFPLAHFATSGVTSDQLFCILWEAVEIIEIDAALKCLFITSDGASPNRRFIRLHKSNEDGPVIYRARNMFSTDDRYIYFISDAPHLIKTTRNCFANSNSHKNTRRLWKDGKDISWMHIVDLFKDHCSGLYRLCPRLSKGHIDLTAYGTMKVRYAAQVLSATVANALEMEYGENVSETVLFIRHMNRFFDCLNVRHPDEAKRKRNPDLEPYTSENDCRINYLLNEFLGYFQQWKQSVEQRPGDFTKSQQNGMKLSYQTLDGLEITIKSVVECIRFCLSEGMPYVLTEKFNQDPIEQHFGTHRSSQGCNTNPNLETFNNSMVQIRMVGSQAIAPYRGNTRRQLEMEPIDNTPLPKRKRQSN